MQLQSSSFADGGAIPGEFAFAVPDPKNHVASSRNRNPQLAWSKVPAGTKSLVLICHDPDVPSRGDDVNQAGREIPADLPRIDFFHWLLADIPMTAAAIVEGAFSHRFTPRGKPGPARRDPETGRTGGLRRDSRGKLKL